MKRLFHYDLQFSKTILSTIVALSLFFFTNEMYSQDKNFIGTKVLRDGNSSLYQTFGVKNSFGENSFLNDSFTPSSIKHDKYVLGGNLVWWYQDGAAIANFTELNNSGLSPLTGWGLNDMRVSLYSDHDNTPVWELSTEPYDPVVAESEDDFIIVAARGSDFVFIEKATGNIIYQLTLPDTLYAVNIGISGIGAGPTIRVICLAQAIGNGTVSRAYSLIYNGTTFEIDWTFDVLNSEITNWTGIDFSSDGSVIVINGRNHLFVLNSIDGSLIWDHFLDNTEAPAVISGDGHIIATADNSGFIQARIFNSITAEYDLLWQYRVPVGTFTNWASSVDISEDGSTIVAGTLLFYYAGFDGSVIAFDTFGDGTPKWIYTGAGDLVDDIALSSDGKVAAAVSWGDLAHSQPDLLVFDVQTGEVSYSITSPGSLFSVDISADGKKVFAGGKAVHAREFGNGGLIYYSEIDLGGGSVSGNVELENSSNFAGVIVRALGTERFGVTEANGNYTIENIPAGTYNITAEKPGYSYQTVSNVTVNEGGATSNIDFFLNLYGFSAPSLSASTDLDLVIQLNWSYRNLSEVEKHLAVDDLAQSNFLTKSTYGEDSNINAETTIEKNALLTADSVAIYRSLASGGPYNKIATVDVLAGAYIDNDVLPLNNYYYVITVFDENGESYYSNEVLGRVNDSLFTFTFEAPQGSVPVIDGVISAGEWDDAFMIDVSDVLGFGGGIPLPAGSVFMYFKFDDINDLLYVAGVDFLNHSLDDNEGFGFYFDDNNNNIFEANGGEPLFREGNFWAYWHPNGSNLRFRPIYTGGVVGTVDTLFDAQVNFSDAAGYVQGEVALPMGFLDGKQLQVYSPEKTPGLGAFLIARSGGAAIFDGWWPQTMNSVFNPQYFGDVKIDVTLTAPPQSPNNISVEKEGDNLLLTWVDPTLGLNNDPLPYPPTINIYRNEEFITSIDAGVQSYLDENVGCELWYEYKFEAYIIAGSDTLISPITQSYGNFACKDPELNKLTYDDGSWEAFYVVSFDYEENKFALRFSPSFYPSRIVRLETLVNNNGDFDLTIHKDSLGLPGEMLAGPYRVAATGVGVASTIMKTLPGEDPPLLKEGDYWVVINYLPELPGNPGIGVDVNTPISDRGYFYLSSTGWQYFASGNLMISSYIADTVSTISNSESENKLPLTFQMNQNYPNPFNPSTIISYQIPQSEFVSLEIFNALGEKINSLINQFQNAGAYSIQWDGNNFSGSQVSSGIYFYRIKAGNFNSVKKMILLR